MKGFRLLVAVLAIIPCLSACGGNDNPTSPPRLQMGGGIQGAALTLSRAVSTAAGDGTIGATDCTVGTGASFNYPCGIATDGRNLYVADSNNNTVREIALSTSAVTLVAGDGTVGATDCTAGAGASFSSPRGITTDGANLYVADSGNNIIRKIVISTGAVTTVAGDGTVGATDCTAGAGASFSGPRGITTDGQNLYVADSGNNIIRKIVISTGAVTTVAGDGTGGASDNAVGTQARFNAPYGITTDGTSLYVADSNNHLIRRIVIGGAWAVSTVAGDGTAGGADNTVGTRASFNGPYGITTDGTSLFVADTNNQTIRKVAIGGAWAVSTVAGAEQAWGWVDDTGPAARFYTPRSITTDGTFLYVADTRNNRIRKIQ